MNLLKKLSLLTVLLAISLFSHADLEQDYEDSVCEKFRDVLQTTPLHTWDERWIPRQYHAYASTWDNDDCKVTFFDHNSIFTSVNLRASRSDWFFGNTEFVSIQATVECHITSDYVWECGYSSVTTDGNMCYQYYDHRYDDNLRRPSCSDNSSQAPFLPLAKQTANEIL